jgi:N-acetylneuraminic acid mutarotase/uncharacterized coiled-coil protein SlyX
MMSNRRVASLAAVCAATLLASCALINMSFVASAELPEDWQVEEPMATGLTQAVVLQGNDGLVYFMGGVRDMSGGSYGPVVGDVRSYDPGTGEWLDLAPMPYGVRGAAGALGGDGRIFVFGGVNDSASTEATTQIYDPVADAWTLGADVPLGVWEAKAVGINVDEILVVGGEFAYSSTQKYNIADDTWSAGGSLPSGVLAGALLKRGYYCYYIGGSDSGYTAVDTIFVYDSWSDAWSLVDPMPVPTAGHAAVLGADNLIYVVGGADTAYNIEWGYNTSYCFNPDSGEWTQLANISDGVRYLGAAASDEGLIYAFGGNNNTAVLPQVHALRVMELSLSLSPSEVHPGDSVLVTMSVEFANQDEITGSDFQAYILTSEGIPVNPVYGWLNGPYSTVAIELEVPSSIEPGIHSAIVLWYVGTYSSGVELPQQEIQFTVVDAPTLDERVAALESLVANLETQLADLAAQLDAMSSDMNATEAALLDEIAAVEDEISRMEANLSALFDSLEQTRESVDDVQASVDSMLYAVVGLLVVVIVLLVVMMVMGRRPKTPAPMPEPPVE